MNERTRAQDVSPAVQSPASANAVQPGDEAAQEFAESAQAEAPEPAGEAADAPAPSPSAPG